MLTAASTVTVKGQVANPAWQPERDRGTEAVFQHKWPLHIVAETNDIGGEAVQRVTAAVEQPSLPGKKTKVTDAELPHLPVAHLTPADAVAVEVSNYSLHWLARRRPEGQNQHTSLSGWYALWLNPVEKTDANAQTCLSLAPCTPLQPTSGTW